MVCWCSLLLIGAVCCVSLCVFVGVVGCFVLGGVCCCVYVVVVDCCFCLRRCVI